uniref:Uncharacterized protein n=1 Tax=Tanacetum cinerariifolium TaxID=118510 RepID=A0A6L2N3W1_TANCI|nr:hypothetical protein [Tanacetum cinerariifolium]
MYGAILPNVLINEAIKDFESYKEYYAIASRAEPLKTKARVKKKQAESDISPKRKPGQALKGIRLKARAKVPKSLKMKLPAQGLETLSEIALSEAEQIKLATKRSKIQFHISYASGSDDDDVDDQSDDDEDDDDGASQGDDDQDDNGEQTELDNSDDDFVHPKLSTYDEEERHDDEDYDEVTQGGNDAGEKMDEEEEVNELYRDVNINLEGSDYEMTDIS